MRDFVMYNYYLNRIKGATMIEYVLIVGLIALGAVVIMTAVGVSITDAFTRIQTALTGE
jgi:Flp pilus assembly pilin Flp